MNNYELQKYLFGYLKQFQISNPNKIIDRQFVYSLLEQFNIQNHGMDISNNFEYWMNRYEGNPNIKVFEFQQRPFLWFQNGRIRGNEIKIYVPLDINHIKEGANLIFDYISSNNIVHQSKIATIIRTDNVVIRVTTLEDADKIINFVTNNEYLKEGLLNVNPFLPNYNGLGITMDNFTTYNGNVAQIISDFLNLLKNQGRLDLFNVEEFNNYVKSAITYVDDPDIKDIYTILSQVTKPNFDFKEFVAFIRNKIADKYDNNKTRITDPEYYFDEAIKITEQIHPGFSKPAIFKYLKGDSSGFTRDSHARAGLEKYVHPGDLISIMRSRLNSNNIPIPNNDDELINHYLDIVLNKNMNKENLFDIIKSAYISTLNAYGKAQARAAVNNLIINREIDLFTNSNGDRTRLRSILNYDIKKIIISNIDISNLDINDIKEIVNRFENIINPETLSNQKV